MQTRKKISRWCAVVAVGTLVAGTARGNGGPFVVKYPGGDPAAKGVLARLDPGLKPARETRLEVVKEDLGVKFTQDFFRSKGPDRAPLVQVTAEYTIRNPSKEDVEMDFGFPILRGIYISPYSMMPRPQVHVKVDDKHTAVQIISNSEIYGIIRARCRETIDAGVLGNKRLEGLVARAKKTGDEGSRAAGELRTYLVTELKWGERDAALMTAYAGMDMSVSTPSRLRGFWFRRSDPGLSKMAGENLGPLSAIGEQKATQLFAQLAGLFDPAVKTGYEEIFTAWGGDVRERVVDLETGKVRPREIVLSGSKTSGISPHETTEPDMTTYARVDYLDKDSSIGERDRDACNTILKNLPVIFTFAPMNLLHYRVTFPAGSEKKVAVSYSQFAYLDTSGTHSYQLAYVVHPASLWERFGPITLSVKVPEGVTMVSSVPCERKREEEKHTAGRPVRYVTYGTTVADKTGELFVGIDAGGWKAATRGEKDKAPAKTARADR
ncbi:MAG: hypothetical protein HQ559_01285 [Lentisphaerae bacterium]|nr:hypothetical protein [Lentisphaerota bacterium]